MIRSGHLGNGLTIWDDKHFTPIAHINPDRTVHIYSYMSIEDIEEILDIAKYDDRTISVTQDEKVFVKPPYKKEI